MKRIFAVLLSVMLIVGLTACGSKPANVAPASSGETQSSEGETKSGGIDVGIVLPTKDEPRWVQAVSYTHLTLPTIYSV